MFYFVYYELLPVLFFHRYQLYITFYYSYVNSLTIIMCDTRVNDLVNIN